MILSRTRAAVVQYATLVAAALVAAGATIAFEWAANEAEFLYRYALTRSRSVLVVGCIALGGVAWVARVAVRGIGGSGVPEVLAAVRVHDPVQRTKLVALPTALLRAAFTLVALFFGAAVGRQGPSVSLSAAIVHALRPHGSQDDARLSRAAIAMGAAAGVTAAYNTPFAALLFVIEEVGFAGSGALLSVIAAAAAAAGLTTLLMGHAPHFNTYAIDVVDSRVWMGSLAAAAAAGISGALFARAVVALPTFGSGLRDRRPWLSRLLGAAVVASLSMFAAGTGELPIGNLLAGSGPGAFYPLIKAVATLACFWIGLAGGLFGPAISIGAGIGGAVHLIIDLIPPAPLVLSAMAGFLAAATRAPLTAAAFAVEVAGAYSGTPLLAAAALVGAGISRLTLGQGMYSGAAARILERSLR